MLEKVKPRLGIFYSDPAKEAEIQDMINGALDMFKGSGWKINASSPSPMAVETVILYCKMAQSTDPTQLINHPVLISMIAQGRAADEVQP